RAFSVEDGARKNPSPLFGMTGFAQVAGTAGKSGDRLDVRSLLAFRADGHIELHPLILGQRLVAAAILDCRKMRKKVFSAFVRSNEAEAFRVIEPFHSTSCHCISYLDDG